jgi:hypothetical protein
LNSKNKKEKKIEKEKEKGKTALGPISLQPAHQRTRAQPKPSLFVAC